MERKRHIEVRRPLRNFRIRSPQSRNRRAHSSHTKLRHAGLRSDRENTISRFQRIIPYRSVRSFRYNVKSTFSGALTFEDRTTLVEGMEHNRLFIACRHRAAGSSDVYFGPFASLEELHEFCKAHKLAVAVLELVDPSTPEDGWWN